MSEARKPLEAKPERMAKLARLPVFLALEGKRALLAGGSAAAAWKAELLSAAGARVDVYARDVSDEMRAVAADAPGGAIDIIERDWTAEDFGGAAIAIGAFDDDEAAVGLRASRAARWRAGQCHRQAGVLRFLLRRHRQSLAVGDRHFDRWRGAGVRASDPRQARSPAAERLCVLGASGRQMAQRL